MGSESNVERDALACVKGYGSWSIADEELAPENLKSRQCLFAPASLYRQAKTPVRLGDRLYPRNSLFVLETGDASRQDGGSPLVFMEETWSRCPGSQWVPAMLEGLWRRATAR